MQVEVTLNNEEVPKCTMNVPDNWGDEKSTELVAFLDKTFGSGNWTGCDSVQVGEQLEDEPQG